MSLLVRTSTDAGALLVQDTDDPFALAVTESTSPLALRVRESTSPLAMRVRGLFSPASLPGLAAWYDASDSNTVLTTVSPDVPATDGQTVRRWVSRHNPAVFFDQSVLLNQPTFTNPTTGLTFNGTSSFMNGTGTMAGVFRDRGYGYIFAVAVRNSDLSSPIVLFSVNGGTLSRLGYFPRVAGNAYAASRRLDADSVTEALAASGNINEPNLNEVFANWAGGTVRNFVNGVGGTSVNLPSAGNTSDTNSTHVILGDNPAGTAKFNGNIRELIICNEQLTAAQILSTRRYLQRKWSTPALP
jgi:hypothetical protein